MSTPTLPAVVYPESDGQPMAENTRQYQQIVRIKENLEIQYRHQPRVFIAADLFWYPEEGHPDIRQAPDVLVVFDRPKGERGSYRQWEEGGIAPQVVFEILSPSNRHDDLARKFLFYERYGVEEYYVYDPDHNTLDGWRRHGEQLREIPNMSGWVSPRLGTRFALTDDGLKLYHPDGRPFLTTVELEQQRIEAEHRAHTAEHRAHTAEHRADSAEQRAARLAAQLRAQGIEPEA